MRVFTAVLTAAAFCVFPVLASSHNDVGVSRRHHQLEQARGLDSSPAVDNVSHIFEERAFMNARFSFYHAGLGACGDYNGDGDSIVALNVQQFGNRRYCGQRVRISFHGRSVEATIKDCCMGCGYGGLDLTPSLFSRLASLGAGIIHGEWEFIGSGGGGGGGGGHNNTSSTKHSTKHTTEPATTSQHHSTHTTHSTTHHSSHTSTKTQDDSSSTSTPTSTPTPTGPNNNDNLLKAFKGMSFLLQAAAEDRR